MATIHLNKKALEQAEKLIKSGQIETFDNDWAEEAPTTDEVINYLGAHSMEEYGAWYLGENPATPKNLKEHYDYPYGDLKTVQRCALVDTIKRAEKSGHKDIAQIAKRLLEMVDKRGKA